MMTSPYTTCDYVKRAGVCGKRCFGGRCNIHRKRVAQTLCLKQCGRGTRSRTGYCKHCGWAQNDHGHRMKKKERAMDALIDELLSWDWEGIPALLCPATCATQPTVESAACGSSA